MDTIVIYRGGFTHGRSLFTIPDTNSSRFNLRSMVHYKIDMDFNRISIYTDKKNI